MFKFLKETFSDGYNKLKECFNLNKENIDKNIIEKTLLEQNFAPELIKNLIKKIENSKKDWQESLQEELLNIFPENQQLFEEVSVFILVGINGSGKTTSAIKLAREKNKNFKSLLVPADTFRAAAKEQLYELAKRYNVDFFNHEFEQPSMVIFKASEYYKENEYKKIIIDTAGRIHQNEGLIRELTKSINTAKKQFINEKIATYLVLDGLQGKNLLEQTKLFSNAISIDGIILTKIDAGVKPGIIFSIVDSLKIPIIYLGIGQNETDLIKFNSKEFVNSFFN